jgi:F0F1-type ATP synthase assembly protein I
MTKVPGDTEEDEVESAERALSDLLASEPEIFNLLDPDADLQVAEPVSEPPPGQAETVPPKPPEPTNEPANSTFFPPDERNEPFIFSAANQPVESRAETIRKSGLAWSAGIIFFGSVVFMLIIGWFADLLLGSAPWGLVGGIVLGSIIGFIQFFRINAAMLRGTEPKGRVGLFGPDNEDR